MNEEELKIVEELGAAFFALDQIALVLEIDIVELKALYSDNQSSFFKAYMKGKLRNEMEIRKSVIELAKRGSAQAQELAFKFITELKLKELE